MNEIEKAWVACAIDGEGTVFFRDNCNDSKFKNRERGRKVGILITNTNLDFIIKAKELMNCHTKIKIYNRGGNRKTTYHVGLYDISKSLELLKQIVPYLIIKKQKAEDIIKHFKERPRLKRTEEARKKQSQRMTGHLVSEETRKKIGHAHKGHIVNSETRKKIALAHKGKKHSDKFKLEQSERIKQWWKKQKV